MKTLEAVNMVKGFEQEFIDVEKVSHQTLEREPVTFVEKVQGMFGKQFFMDVTYTNTVKQERDDEQYLALKAIWEESQKTSVFKSVARHRDENTKEWQTLSGN